MIVRINMLTRWYFIWQTKRRIDLANKCIKMNGISVDLYCKLKDQKDIDEYKANFKRCLENIDAARQLLAKWTELLANLRDGLVESIEVR